MRGGCGPRWDRRLEKLHPPALAVSACGGTEWNLPPCLVQAVPGLLRAPAQMLHGEEGGEFGTEVPQRWSRAPPRAPAQNLALLRIHRDPSGLPASCHKCTPSSPDWGQSRSKIQVSPRPSKGPHHPAWPFREGVHSRDEAVCQHSTLHPPPHLGAPVGIQEPRDDKEAPVMAVALHLIETARLWASSCVCPKRVPLSMPSQVTSHQPCGWWEEVPHAETGAWSPTCHCHFLDIP